MLHLIRMAKAIFLLLVGFGIVVVTALSLRPKIASNVNDYSGRYQTDFKIGWYHGEKVAVPTLAKSTYKTPVLGVATPTERWVEIDLSEQKLKAWDGSNLFLESLVSTGLPWWPTPQGEFRIWAKLRYVRMNGGEGKYAYDLPNVPFTMFFENANVPSWRGYGLHGTYWHNDFGRVHSHGCVNLPTKVAEQLYYWTTPALPDGKSSAMSTDSNPGTRIIIHD